MKNKILEKKFYRLACEGNSIQFKFDRKTKKFYFSICYPMEYKKEKIACFLTEQAANDCINLFTSRSKYLDKSNFNIYVSKLFVKAVDFEKYCGIKDCYCNIDFFNSVKGIPDTIIKDLGLQKKDLLPEYDINNNILNIYNATYLDNNALENIENVKKIIFPENLLKLDEKTFCNLEKLEILDFSNSNMLQNFNPYTFVNCPNLKSLIFPKNLTQSFHIYENAFYNCPKLQYLERENNLVILIDSPFKKCPLLNKQITNLQEKAKDYLINKLSTTNFKYNICLNELKYYIINIYDILEPDIDFNTYTKYTKNFDFIYTKPYFKNNYLELTLMKKYILENKESEKLIYNKIDRIYNKVILSNVDVEF